MAHSHHHGHLDRLLWSLKVLAAKPFVCDSLPSSDSPEELSLRDSNPSAVHPLLGLRDVEASCGGAVR